MKTQLLGTNKSYLHSMMCQLQKNLESSVFGMSVAWTYWKHCFWNQTSLTFATLSTPKSPPLKLVCLALAWLGTDENKNSFMYLFSIREFVSNIKVKRDAHLYIRFQLGNAFGHTKINKKSFIYRYRYIYIYICVCVFSIRQFIWEY